MACKEWHDLPANATKQRGTHQNPPDLNPNNLKIVRFREHMEKDGTVIWNFFPDQCRHCLTPICKDVADMAVPGAIIKDPKTGAVLTTEKSAKLSPEDAQAVIDACPYNIPRLDPKTRRLTKCDMPSIRGALDKEGYEDVLIMSSIAVCETPSLSGPLRSLRPC